MLFFIDFAALVTFWLVIIFLFGLYLLGVGADWLTNGAGSLALLHKINPLVVGMTIVAAATSMPELVTVLIAAARDKAGLAIGNLLGSNVANIGLILGFVAIVAPIHVQARMVRSEAPLLIGMTAAFSLLALGGRIERWEGAVLAFIMVAYFYSLVRRARAQARADGGEDEDAAELGTRLKTTRGCLIAVAVGALVLSVGAEALVNTASELAVRLGVSDIVVGLTVVAIGTSLPELAASVAAAAKGQSDLCAGNIVGSNLFNMLAIGGGVSIVFPLDVDPVLFAFEVPAMFVMTFLLWVCFLTGRRVSRTEGGILLFLYIATIAASCVLQLDLLD